MNNMTWVLAVWVAFSLGALAQSGNSSSGSSGSQASSSPQQSTPPASSDMGAGEASKKTKEKNASHSANGKDVTLTGCLNAPNEEGAYTLVNHRYQHGVVVGGNDELPKHVGHEVKLTGTWASAKDIGVDTGKQPQAGKQMAYKLKHFKVDSIQHIAETCKMKPGRTKQKSPSSGSTQ